MATLSPQQLDVLVRTVLGEAANQGLPGEAAVADVIKNRANSGKFPSDPAAVALQPYQFSAWNSLKSGGNNVGKDADPNSRSYQQAAQAVQAVFNGQMDDATHGALYYHTGAVHPTWDKSMVPTAQIGAHTFYTPTGQATGPGMTSLPVALASIKTPDQIAALPQLNPPLDLMGDQSAPSIVPPDPTQTPPPDLGADLQQRLASLGQNPLGALGSLGKAAASAFAPQQAQQQNAGPPPLTIVPIMPTAPGAMPTTIVPSAPQNPADALAAYLGQLASSSAQGVIPRGLSTA